MTTESLFFDDFTVGLRFETKEARTIGEETVRLFAEVSGDRNPLHLDDQFAASTLFGKRIAHGLLGLSVGSGLLHVLGIVRQSILAFTSLIWRFKKPIELGDRLSLKLEVEKVRSLGSRGGLVIFLAALINQKG